MGLKKQLKSSLRENLCLQHNTTCSAPPEIHVSLMPLTLSEGFGGKGGWRENKPIQPPALLRVPWIVPEAAAVWSRLGRIYKTSQAESVMRGLVLFIGATKIWMGQLCFYRHACTSEEESERRRSLPASWSFTRSFRRRLRAFNKIPFDQTTRASFPIYDFQTRKKNSTFLAHSAVEHFRLPNNKSSWLWRPRDFSSGATKTVWIIRKLVSPRRRPQVF